MPAQMATQPRHMSVKGERHTAIRAIARFAAIAAKQRSGRAASTQKLHWLFAFLKTIGNGCAQFFRQNCCSLFFSTLLAKIDNAHEWHLLFVDALGERSEAIFARCRVVITLQRWRRAAKNNHTLLDLRAHDRDIPRMITRRFLLFVSVFVFFIHNDEPEFFERCEDRAARPDGNPRPAGMNLVPLIVALAFG